MITTNDIQIIIKDQVYLLITANFIYMLELYTINFSKYFKVNLTQSLR